MKKTLLTILGMSLIPGMVYAAAPKDCSYSPLQQVIRAARTEEDIQKLLDDHVSLNITPRCGGNVIQLATLRGNPNIFKKILENGNLPLDVKVPNTDYPIPGAPKEIPLGFFVAYYAPRMDMMQLFMQTGVDLMGTDERGETILWYLEQNPVLRDTELSDMVMRQLLVSASSKNEAVKEKAAEPKNNKDAKADAKNGRRPKGNPGKKGKSDDGDLVDAEPDNPYRPQAADGLGSEEF